MVSLHPGKIETTIGGSVTYRIVADPKAGIVASHNPPVVRRVRMDV